MDQNLGSFEVPFLNEKSLHENDKLLIHGSIIHIVNELESFFKAQFVKLIYLDLSKNFLENDIRLREEILDRFNIRISDKNQFEEQMLKKPVSATFFKEVETLFKISKSILGNHGFFGVMVNGVIKSVIKSKLDKIFGLNNFVNEILIDSPYKITYSERSNVFERTNSFLLYSQNSNPRINPVFNRKKSGGYWHSFVSKGQGSHKKFIFGQRNNKKEVLLAPPPGTHWKLKQETILQLCSEGKIRLNKKGSPEYWVPERYGQIIDSNWLDIPSFNWHHKKHLVNSLEFYERLMKLCMNEGDIFLDLSVELGNSIIIANKLKMKWIGIEEDDKKFQLMIENLSNNNIPFSAYKFNSTPDRIMRLKHSFNQIKANYNVISSKPLKNMSLLLIERYPSSNPAPENLFYKKFKNKLILGDCFDVLPLLKPELKKKIKIIYIDPPFFTGTDEKIIIPIGLSKGQDLPTFENIVLPIEDLAYKNVLEGHYAVEVFKKWFEDRIQLMRPLLREDGFLFVRFDYHFGTYAKIILDETFGKENFVNEFLVRRMKKNLSLKQAYSQTHLIVHSDSLFVYRGSEKARFKISNIKKKKRKNQDPVEYQFPNDNLWIDIAGYQKVKRTLYPTENSEALLTRIIKMASEKGDIIADFFCGSGTTVAIAEKLERRWVGVDIGHYSVHEIKKRILNILPRAPFDYFITNQVDPLCKRLKTNSNETLSGKMPTALIVPLIKKNIVELRIKDFFPSKLENISQNHDFLDLIDFWSVDWDYQGDFFRVNWHSFREMKGKIVLKNVEVSTTHEYKNNGQFTIAIMIVDIFGNAAKKYFDISIK
ncbi:MAG: DNA methyltransferase [Candidatus Hodarchaeota archaeon]